MTPIYEYRHYRKCGMTRREALQKAANNFFKIFRK